MTFNQRVADVLDRFAATSPPDNIAPDETQHCEPAAASCLPLESAGLTVNHDTIIVVVEDDDMLRAVICEALRRVGFTASGHSNAKDAVDFLLARKSSSTILVTDLVLNGSEGGWSLAQRVRQLFPAVPILLISGYIDEPALHATTAQGKISFLPKPFELRALVSTIKSLSEAA